MYKTEMKLRRDLQFNFQINKRVQKLMNLIWGL